MPFVSMFTGHLFIFSSEELAREQAIQVEISLSLLNQLIPEQFPFICWGSSCCYICIRVQRSREPAAGFSLGNQPFNFWFSMRRKWPDNLSSTFHFFGPAFVDEASNFLGFYDMNCS